MVRAGRCFNPRAHAGRDRHRRDCGQGRTLFQSTRPRRARLGTLGRQESKSIVSIHAPTQGATETNATVDRAGRCFNPRAHAGRDVESVRRGDAGVFVSIHAPTQGATGPAPKLETSEMKFQSTRPRRARHCPEALRRRDPRRFNPRAHAGRDGLHKCFGVALQRFNPRAHAGRDAIVIRLSWVCVVSIHAPTQGATRSEVVGKDGIVRFNPRAHAGRDRYTCAISLAGTGFNPRAHAGRDT